MTWALIIEGLLSKTAIKRCKIILNKKNNQYKYRPFAMGGARTYVVMVNVVVAILSVKRAPKLLTVID